MTILTESFNKADADTLGPDQTWVEDRGDIDVVSNKARVITTGDSSIARVATNLATANHYVQAKVDSDSASPNGSLGVIARKTASVVETFYLFDADYDTGTVRLYHDVNDNFTQIIPDVAHTLNASTQYLLKLSVDGSSIETTVDGVSKHSTTDSTITGNLQAGVRASLTGSPVANYDEWEAGDIGPTPKTFTGTSNLNG